MIADDNGSTGEIGAHTCLRGVDVVVVENLDSSTEEARATNGHPTVCADHAIAVHVRTLADGECGTVEDLNVAAMGQFSVPPDLKASVLEHLQRTEGTDALDRMQRKAAAMAQAADYDTYKIVEYDKDGTYHNDSNLRASCSLP